jgi:hypothetical protein
MVRPPRPADEGASKNVFKVALFKMILLCHVISVVQFVRQIKKENPSWICVIKPSDVGKNTKKTKIEVDCSELLKGFADVEADPTFPEPRNVDMPLIWNLGVHL